MPHTIRHILRRAGLQRPHQTRSRCYPGAWAWETQEPFSLIQADVKDILDKHALGTAAWDHLRKHPLPRYQWTACEACTRMRFLASSHTRTRSIGVAFLLLVTFWLRAHGIERPLVFQTDWGQEFGGDNPTTMQALEHRFLSFKPNWPALPKGASNTMGEWNAATAPIGRNSIGRS